MTDEWDHNEVEVCDRILGQTAGLLAQRGDDQSVALLVDVRAITIVDTDELLRTQQVSPPFGLSEYDLITVKIYSRVAVLDVDDHLVERFTEEIRQRIANTLKYVAERNSRPDVTSVRVRPALPVIEGDWRTSYAQRLERPTNQARRESGAANHPVQDGLTFGSKEELRVYQALSQLQAAMPEHDAIAIAPLPGVRLRSGNTWSPDLLVLGRGSAVIVETDGPHHRNQRRYVDDRNRDLQWQRAGIPVVRLAVEDLGTDDELKRRLVEELRRHLGRQA
ncbi:hypothetical protein [Actinoplanes teichomyceticus]|uniref:hypothetical protein n=1 Tax=Actinoplanes teichomyceticus TaxID=1867 RepID=UPI0013DE0A46|nr:hypothetical protein [Actinoplanes teichomyceticus]